MSKVTTSSRSRSFAKAFLAKLDGETEKGETVEKATLKAEKEQKQKQREQTLSRPSRLGLGATVSNNAASGKPELAAGIRKAHRRAKRQHDGSDEDECEDTSFSSFAVQYWVGCFDWFSIFEIVCSFVNCD
eukprot:m.55781 g.55781  ORF g.55781 m.55781 type:complete len:131 (+) comp11519_c0_seq2:42-434(+)